MFNWFKRISLFLAVNLLVILTISLLLAVLDVRPYLNEYGIDYGQLAIFCLIWGMCGAFISLGISRIMAKMAMGVKVIDPNTSDPTLRDLVQTVHRLAKAANLPKMPEVGLYNSPEVNAFATGPTKARSLVAVSSGLLQRMNKPEVEGVLSHEVAHIANGDMVTMTLLQGIINAFVMFIARILAFAVTQAMSRNNERPSYMVQHMFVIVFQILLSFFGMIVVASFSRWREFRADRGGAQLAGAPKMIAALEALRHASGMIDDRQEAIAAFKISGRRGKFAALFSTHPPLETRIQRLKTFT